jgi:CPA2 family monovalent cation:H+ antiporter-2
MANKNSESSALLMMHTILDNIPSFIFAEEAVNLNLLPREGFDILVAVALLTISLNPLLFQVLEPFENLLSKLKLSKSPRRQNDLAKISEKELFPAKRVPIVGFGPIGEEVAAIVKKNGYSPVIIEHNIDTVADKEGVTEIMFGDATEPMILKEAGIEKAKFLFITIPDTETTFGIIEAAKRINPDIKIVARTRYIDEGKKIKGPGITFISAERESLAKFASIVNDLFA